MAYKMEKPTEYFELFDRTLMEHLTKMFSAEIQRDYDVTGLAQIDGKWVAKLSRKLEAYARDAERKPAGVA